MGGLVWKEERSILERLAAALSRIMDERAVR